MNILFVNHNDFSSNSGVHVANLSNHLIDLGVDVAAAVPDWANPVPVEHSAYTPLSYSNALSHRFRDGRGADLVHAWTPRQTVARCARELADKHGCPYVVHLEDNEHAITAVSMGLSIKELLVKVRQDPGFKIPGNLSHPDDMRHLLNHAAGATVLMDRLLEFVPTCTPSVVVWPAAEDALFMPRPPDEELRAELGIDAKTTVVVYHGNVHAANVAEVRSLYLAIGALSRRGLDVVLVRLGFDHVPLLPDAIADIDQLVIHVPFQTRERLPLYLSLANVLIQPGRVDDFNAYRFPSKLPEFFAMGKPVILPATNIGLHVIDEVDALLLRRGDAVDIASKIEKLLQDQSAQDRLSRGARDFYNRNMDWGKSARALLNFYTSLSPARSLDRLDSDIALAGVANQYAAFRPAEAFGYATVQDYSEGVANLRALATINRDLKDAQRPWVFKAIIGMVPRGGRLLEIGAGDPWVADLLARLGYEVVIVDPYDGRDRGPAEYENIKAQYPNITFLRGLFPDALSTLSDDKFDCIYSISVLEHIPIDAVSSVFCGMAQHARSGEAMLIHAVDNVLLGAGDAAHRDHLIAMASHMGLSAAEVDAVLCRLQSDPDAYFMSADAHNRWRGTMAYDAFPMRRCISIQLCTPARSLIEVVTKG